MVADSAEEFYVTCDVGYKTHQNRALAAWSAFSFPFSSLGTHVVTNTDMNLDSQSHSGDKEHTEMLLHCSSAVAVTPKHSLTREGSIFPSLMLGLVALPRSADCFVLCSPFP